uniref:Uncharacterized protein n=1 Tax=Anopheles maculatus TaxID=74869 RepID=A0A182ST83_9DIPT
HDGDSHGSKPGSGNGPTSGGGGGSGQGGQPGPPSSGINGSGGGGSGRGGNGGDPHLNRPVGGGGAGRAPSASSGTSALLAKLFAEPLRDPVPSGTQFLPCNTEKVVSEREGKETQYSPVMWADPLFPLNITVGSTSSAIDRMPAVGVSVNNRLDA